MANVIGPLLSLSASGLFSKALFYYDTKYGARVRKPKSIFTPPSQIWEVNIGWFKQASARFKTFTSEIKNAWKLVYTEACDTYRDIFMGQQIAAWNLHPTNDITWPQVTVVDIGDFTFAHGTEYVSKVSWWFDESNDALIRKWTCGSLWWNLLDNPNPPNAGDEYEYRTSDYYSFPLIEGHTNYLWGGVRYVDGQFKAVFLDSYVR